MPDNKKLLHYIFAEVQESVNLKIDLDKLQFLAIIEIKTSTLNHHDPL